MLICNHSLEGTDLELEEAANILVEEVADILVGVAAGILVEVAAGILVEVAVDILMLEVASHMVVEREELHILMAAMHITEGELQLLVVERHSYIAVVGAADIALVKPLVVAWAEPLAVRTYLVTSLAASLVTSLVTSLVGHMPVAIEQHTFPLAWLAASSLVVAVQQMHFQRLP